MCLFFHVFASPVGIVGLSAKFEPRLLNKWRKKYTDLLTLMEKMSAGMPRNNEVMLRKMQPITRISVVIR